jgi:hypothetical protein
MAKEKFEVFEKVFGTPIKPKEEVYIEQGKDLRVTYTEKIGFTMLEEPIRVNCSDLEACEAFIKEFNKQLSTAKEQNIEQEHFEVFGSKIPMPKEEVEVSVLKETDTVAMIIIKKPTLQVYSFPVTPPEGVSSEDYIAEFKKQLEEALKD